MEFWGEVGPFRETDPGSRSSAAGPAAHCPSLWRMETGPFEMNCFSDDSEKERQQETEDSGPGKSPAGSPRRSACDAWAVMPARSP